MKITTRIAIFFITLGSMGCTYSSHFDCPAGEGNKCTSLSQNDQKITRGEYDREIVTEDPTVESAFYFREDFITGDSIRRDVIRRDVIPRDVQ